LAAAIKKIGANVFLICVSKANFRLARRKLALTLHFPYFQIAQNPVKENWGPIGDKILKYFKETPE